MTATLNPALPSDIEALLAAVMQEACDRNLTLATAESCTGGLLASMLTDVEGCSHAFDRGFVTYTDEAKHEVLGVPKDLLQVHGAVSRPVAEAMAAGALERASADVAVSITGFAGPGEADEEPGLVFIGLAARTPMVLAHEAHFGDLGRGGVRIAALRLALEGMKAFLSSHAPPASSVRISRHR